MARATAIRCLTHSHRPADRLLWPPQPARNHSATERGGGDDARRV